ncbi:hypothetical protein [Modestobacter sp. SSW1-42]|uniref:hypothetical protein n=1 Tax=Modestobacter sp. SSW1-42 TaxID=596372 RepID=UPI003985C794
MRIGHRLGTRLPGGLAAGLAALLLAGCSSADDAPVAAASGSSTASSSAAPTSESRTGAQVAAAAADALEAAGSVHVSGTTGTGAEQQTLDLQLQGADVSGTITAGGQTVQLLTVGGTSWFQGGADFWAGFGAPAEQAGELAGRWVVVPPEQAAALDQLTLAGVAAELRDPSDGVLEDAVTTEQLDGAEVRVVTQADGSALYVAAADPQVPLQIVDSGTDAGTLTFDRHGETTAITPPADALDLGQLGA